MKCWQKPSSECDAAHCRRLPVLVILVNFNMLLYCTRITVGNKEYSTSNVFSACGGVVMYI